MMKGTYFYYINPHVADTDSSIIHINLVVIVRIDRFYRETNASFST